MVQECPEAAISPADHFDPIGFLKSLLPFGGGLGALARGHIRLARAVAQRGPTGGDGGPGGPLPSSEEDVSVALELSSSDDAGLDPEAESSEYGEGAAVAGSSLRTDVSLVTLLVFLTFLVLSPAWRRDLATRRSSSWESTLRRASMSSTNLSLALARESLVCWTSLKCFNGRL